MFADIIPLKRLPKHIGPLTYAVPGGMELVPGQLVTIPFRTKVIFGIVKQVHADSRVADASIKLVQSLVHNIPFLTPEHLRLIQFMGQMYGIAESNAALLFLPPLQKRKLKTITLQPFPPKNPGTLTMPTYHAYESKEEHTACLMDAIHGITLILVPEKYLLQEVQKSISIESVTWNSDLPTKEQFDLWTRIRNGEVSCVIGTRGALFLPFPHIDTIIIDYEHDENQKHWDQAPRYHTKDISSLYQSLYGTVLHLMSYSMSAESYYHVHKNSYQLHAHAHTKKEVTASTLVNMKDERRGGNYSIFSASVSDTLLSTTKDVFLYMNRRGYATGVGCNECGFLARCSQCTLPYIFHEKDSTLRCHYCNKTESMIISCPTCRSPVVKLYGGGTELIEREVRKLLENRPHTIVRIDSDDDHHLEEETSPRIIIGTERAFPFIRWDMTDLIVFMDIDKEIALPEFYAGERVWHRIHDVQYRRNPLSHFYIQTMDPKHILLRSLIEPDRWYRTELNGRRDLHYPPYSYLVRYYFGHISQEKAEAEAKRMEMHLQKELTLERKHGTVFPPMAMHPRYYRMKFWYTIVVKLTGSAWQEDLMWFNRHFPDPWKIDPNPISLLSP
ncbi:MAG TPA: primosomal protein N' [Candidatus Kapabacteria bacterium]|nr:primosomal protein N' [Candidatus Kapabacteria bacterium]